MFGYDNYLPIFALFSFLTVLFFVRALHALAFDYAFSLFLLMTGGFYFNSLNSVRYYLALSIAMFSMKYVLGREYEKFIFWILVGAMFHKSVLLVIPVYLIARFLAAVRLKRWHYFTLGTASVLAILFGNRLLREVVFWFYPYYRNSEFDNGRISYTNVAKCLAVLALCVLCHKKSLKDDLENRFYFFLNLMGLMVYCCGAFLPEISRAGYYLIVSQIFLIPRLIKDMDNRILRRGCYIGVVVSFLIYFGYMLKGMYAVNVRLLPYLNWIFD